MPTTVPTAGAVHHPDRPDLAALLDRSEAEQGTDDAALAAGRLSPRAYLRRSRMRLALHRAMNALTKDPTAPPVHVAPVRAPGENRVALVAPWLRTNGVGQLPGQWVVLDAPDAPRPDRAHARSLVGTAVRGPRPGACIRVNVADTTQVLIQHLPDHVAVAACSDLTCPWEAHGFAPPPFLPVTVCNVVFHADGSLSHGWTRGDAATAAATLMTAPAARQVVRGPSRAGVSRDFPVALPAA